MGRTCMASLARSPHPTRRGQRIGLQVPARGEDPECPVRLRGSEGLHDSRRKPDDLLWSAHVKSPHAQLVGWLDI